MVEHTQKSTFIVSQRIHWIQVRRIFHEWKFILDTVGWRPTIVPPPRINAEGDRLRAITVINLTWKFHIGVDGNRDGSRTFISFSYVFRIWRFVFIVTRNGIVQFGRSITNWKIIKLKNYLLEKFWKVREGLSSRWGDWILYNIWYQFYIKCY